MRHFRAGRSTVRGDVGGGVRAAPSFASLPGYPPVDTGWDFPPADRAMVGASSRKACRKRRQQMVSRMSAARRHDRQRARRRGGAGRYICSPAAWFARSAPLLHWHQVPRTDFTPSDPARHPRCGRPQGLPANNRKSCAVREKNASKMKKVTAARRRIPTCCSFSTAHQGGPIRLPIGFCPH